ncbi:cupin domain-containing protein [Streptomyces sp. 1331.2]|uniref:cupin domain-containing protein n=1 Tax=Streptomyces sp. 1331.2 TaxID=1938835 RepID=UPI000BC56675|nr:cupin domain-containing protein [Streptomyces sp. 1331.2]SOB79413.1 Mannose-6-phosphate isomerase, cupin superfamily [Streptomyces sp. 1331.2]
MSNRSGQQPFGTAEEGGAPVVTAPDGAEVRPLLVLDEQGSLAVFVLAPGQVTHAVSHATVQELWYVTAGSGELWRRQGAREETVRLVPGTAASVPLGTAFQFRADEDSDGPLRITAVTMPPWPGTDGEARPEDGPWQPTRR